MILLINIASCWITGDYWIHLSILEKEDPFQIHPNIKVYKCDGIKWLI